MSLSQRLGDLATFHLDDETIHELLLNGKLDDCYIDIQSVLEWLKQLAKLLPSNQRKQMEKARRNLESNCQRIISEYANYFQEYDHIGDELQGSPDYVIILGANDPAVLHTRTQKGIEIARKHPTAKFILSGGGVWTGETEAQKMQEIFMNQCDDSCQIYKEEDSLDTIGNAMFSKLLIVQNGWMLRNRHIMIITSDYHAIRVLSIFRRIFAPKTPIIVEVIRTPSFEQQHILPELTVREMSTAHHSNFSIFRPEGSLVRLEQVKHSPQEPKTWDESEIFYHILMKHNMYKNRFDLLRKYAKYIRF